MDKEVCVSVCGCVVCKLTVLWEYLGKIYQTRKNLSDKPCIRGQ